MDPQDEPLPRSHRHHVYFGYLTQKAKQLVCLAQTVEKGRRKAAFFLYNRYG